MYVASYDNSHSYMHACPLVCSVLTALDLHLLYNTFRVLV